MFPEADDRDGRLTWWALQCHYFGFRWHYFPGSSWFLHSFEDNSYIFMAYCFAVVFTFLIILAADSFARGTITKMAGMLVFINMTTFVFNFTWKATSWWFSIPFSATENSYVCFFTPTSNFRLSRAGVAWPMVADHGTLVPAALEGFIAHFFAWWAVPIATFATAAVFATWSDASALGFAFILFAAWQHSRMSIALAFFLNQYLTWRTRAFMAFFRAVVLTFVVSLVTSA